MLCIFLVLVLIVSEKHLSCISSKDINGHVKLLLEHGYGATFHMFERTINALRNDYFKQRKTFPFVIIPQK